MPAREQRAMLVLMWRPCISGLSIWPLLVLLGLPTATYGQPAGGSDAAPSLLFLSGGVGVGTQGVSGSGGLSASYRSHDVLVRLTYMKTVEVVGPAESSRDFAVLYGRRHALTNGWVRVAAGPGRARLHNASSSTGLAWQLEAAWTPGSDLGVGLAYYGNFNSLEYIGALTVMLHLGVVR